ncbi:MAG: phage portal protein [Pseudomonadota bacterium]
MSDFRTPGGTASGRHHAITHNVVAARALQLVAENVAALDWHLRIDGTRISQHPLLDRLARPNTAMNQRSFLEAIAGHLKLSGQAFILAVEGEGAWPLAWHILHPDSVTVEANKDGWPNAYLYRAGKTLKRYPVDPVLGTSEVLHIRSFHPNNAQTGLGALDTVGLAVELHSAAARWSRSLLENAARPSGALVYEGQGGGPATLTDEQFERLKSELLENYQGHINAGRPLVLEGGLKWQQMAFSPADMDFNTTRNSAARDIALAFGVPPMLLGIPGDNTYANYQEANRAFWRQTILPLARKIGDGIAGWVGRQAGRQIVLDINHETIPALAPEREVLWRQVNEADFLSVEEKRRLLGLETP